MMSKLLKPEEVAQVLAISRAKVIELFDRGKLTGIVIDQKKNRIIRFEIGAIEEFIGKNKILVPKPSSAAARPKPRIQRFSGN